MEHPFLMFLDHTQRRTTVGRTPMDGWSARRRDLSTWQHTTLTTDKYPCPRWDSNPRSQQVSGRRPLLCWDTHTHTHTHIHTHTHLLMNTPRSVGLLWTNDQPDAETSTGQHSTLKTDSWNRQKLTSQMLTISESWTVRTAKYVM